jgi:hypothetical protein
MSALTDRRRWLKHVHTCPQCPHRLCPEGARLATAVLRTAAPSETFGGRRGLGKWG